EPEAACQAPLPCSAISGLPGVSVASKVAAKASIPQLHSGTSRRPKTYRPTRPQKAAEFCNRIPPQADMLELPHHVRFVPILLQKSVIRSARSRLRFLQ